MKNQRMKTRQSIRFSMLAVLLMAVMLVGCLAVTTFAANETETVNVATELDVGYPVEGGLYTKVYDGTTNAKVSAVANTGITIKSAKFESADVGEQSIIVELTKNGQELTVEIPARIVPKTLTWETGKTATATATFKAGATAYEALEVSNLPKLMDGSTEVTGLTITGVTVDLNASAAGTYEAYATVNLGGNYVVDPVKVSIVIKPIEITNIAVSAETLTMSYGDLKDVEALGYDADGNEYPLIASYPAGYGAAGTYTVTFATRDANNVVFAEGVANTAQVVIEKASYQVSFDDLTVTGTKGTNESGEIFNIVVGGNIPADVRDLITYTVDGAAFAGTADYGIYTVTATLPTSSNYAFVDAAGNAVTSLEATLTVNRQYLPVATEDGSYQIFIDGANGIPGNVTATLTPATLEGVKAYKAYTVQIVNNIDGTYSLIIPITAEMYCDDCDELTADDIYFYEGGKLVKASEKAGCTVTIHDGYYQIDGLTGTAAITVAVAPAYHVPFWLTAPGIALLVALILVLLVILFFVGLYLRRIRDEKNQAMVIDTEGEVPAVEPVEIEDKVDVDEAIEETLDEIEENLDVEAEEEEAPADAEATDEAVAEAIEELKDEASEISLEEENTVAEDMADAVAEELAETEPAAEEAEADEEALQAAVAAAMADALNDSADAEGAVVLAAGTMNSEDFRKVVDAIVADAMNATMETAAPVVDEDAIQAFIESGDDADIAEVVAASVETAFARLAENGIAAKAVEGTTEATIAEAVEQAGDANIPETWINEISNTVKKAIIRELIARLITDEPDPDDSIETVAVVEPETEVEEDDNDNDNDDDDDGFSFGGFAGLDLKYIDVKAQPDEYAALLEQERNGEIRIVTRYRKSFESRLVQSQGSVQEYYNAIKNALLAHKGIKNRVSWNYEAFNRGRAHVAKINAKTKTLYLYLALDPAELADTKYGIIDVSSKKKYASVPVLMKIKGERKFKYALELIEKLCEEKMELPKLDVAEVDYRLPYQTVEEMVESGLLKMLVAGVPESYFAEQEAAAAAAEAESTETTEA